MLDNFLDNNEDMEIVDVADEGSGTEDEKDTKKKDKATVDCVPY